MTDNLYKEIKNIEFDIKRWREELHRIPELGLDLPRTSEYIKNELDKLGIEYNTLLNGKAIVALIKGNKSEKTIAIRADMDGLPITEETGLEFSSKNGNMHACGHDGHMASLLAAAKILNENKSKLKGCVKLIFQPGEEYPGGAKPMIDAGVLENPKVDLIIGSHIGQLSKEVEFGNIGIKYGPMMASMDRFYVNVKGKGCHGAYPELGIDPIIMTAEIIQGIQNIKSREIAAVEPCVISICRVNGGINQNIIPDSVEIEGTVRALNKDLQVYISERIEEVVKNTTLSHGGEYDYEYDFKYPPLINNDEETEKLEKILRDSILKDNLTIIKNPLMGGEDMAFYLEKVPGVFFYLSNLKEVDGKNYNHHNSKFNIDEKELWKVVYTFVKYVFEYLA
ncbi:M20 metallopeptidase family protein [Clostridium polynesiense]|uniref:M20 metallopeptidase family protein n=1 Tax=Clostridium polynesiense TaxID=1325933 RepID=UPI00058DBC30|nr:M20 family metallopeptidase [Clostridium polynesiense]